MISEYAPPPTRVFVRKRKIWSPTRQHTLGHLECPACEAVNERLLSIDSKISTMTIRSAGKRFIEWRRPYVKESTGEAFQTQFIALDRFFGDLHLDEISAWHLREYQRTRAANADAMWKRTASAGTINHEINSLSQVLEYAGLWQKLKPHDLRHQVITRMLECGAPDETVMAITGQISRQTLKHYSHIRMEAKMSVVNAIEPRHWRIAEVRRTA